MPARKRGATVRSRQASNRSPRSQESARIDDVLAWLERRGTKKNRDGMARYAIVAPKVFGVSVGTLRDLG